MAKILILGDTHFGKRNNSPAVQDYQNEFFQKQLFPYIEEHKSEIDLIIHMGDMFDQRKYINFASYNFWLQHFIVPMNKFNIPIHLIVGNHDTYFKTNNKLNSPELILHPFKNFKIFKEAYENKELGAIYIPWVNSENLADSKLMIENTEARFCFGHLELSGFTMLAGLTCQHSLLNKNMFIKFANVFSGHFHWRSHSKHINYVGAPFQLEWSDYGNKKGFHIFDTETEKLTFIENPREQYIKLDYDDSGADANFLASMDFTQLKNKFVKLFVKRKTNPYLYTQFLASIYSADTCQLQITDIEMEYQSKEVVADIKDVLTIIKNNINGREIEEDVKPKLIQYMNSLYQKTLY